MEYLKDNTVRLQNIEQTADYEGVDRLNYYGFESFLSLLLEIKCLDDKKVEGIIKFLLDNGLHKLTDKQKWVIQTEVLDKYTMIECPDCQHEMDWEEMYWAVTDECPHCEYLRGKMQEA